MVGAIRGGMGDDGLVQRLQLAVWPDAPGTWRNVDRWPDTQARHAAREVFERLDSFDTTAAGAFQNPDDPLPWVRFDADAQAEFDSWRGDLEARLRAGDMHPAMEAHLAKFRSMVPSLALLCHLADNHEGGPVGQQSLLRALAWSEYLEAHARRIYAPALDPGMAAAVELDKRLGDLPDPFTAKDVYRNHWRYLDLEGTAAAIAVLVDYGRIRGEKTAGPGRQTVRYSVNPTIRDARA
jgi:putative DNA primase/helicase